MTMKIGLTLILFGLTLTIKSSMQQCPWKHNLNDLHSDCICVSNQFNRLSIQCSSVNFTRLLATLVNSTTGSVNKNSAQSAIDLLHIKNASLPEIPEQAFKALTIKDLHISDSGVGEVTADAFLGLSASLQRLSLQDNRLTKVPTSALNDLTALKVLILSNNFIKRLEDDAFASLALTTLQMGDNQLEYISPLAFRGLEKTLKNLNLKGCSLTGIPEAIKELSSLAFLDLANNGIDFIEAKYLRHLRTLTAFSLEGNRIKLINKMDFTGISYSLSSLSLLNNLIKEFPVDAIAQLPELRVLDLGFNEISDVPDNAFHGNPLLTLLALDGNPISRFPSTIFTHLNSTLRGLRIGGNSLICDCHLRWIFDWMKRYNMQVTSRERDPHFCGQPNYLRRKAFWQLNQNDFVCEQSESASTVTSTSSSLIGTSSVEPLSPPTTTSSSSPPPPQTTIFTTTTPSAPKAYISISNDIEPFNVNINHSTTTTTPSTTTTTTTAAYVDHQTRQGSVLHSSLALSSKPSTESSVRYIEDFDIRKRGVKKSKMTRKDARKDERPNRLKVISALRKDSSIVIEWETTSDNAGGSGDQAAIKGYQIVYRYFGNKDIKKGPQLSAKQKKFTITQLPTNECVLVCVLAIEQSETDADAEAEFDEQTEIPYSQCTEIRKERQKIADLDKILIAATVAVCAFVLILVIVFSCCYNRDKQKMFPGGLPPGTIPNGTLPPLSMKGDNEWETVSMYSARSIPRARMYHLDANAAAQHLDETRSHISHYSHVLAANGNNYGKSRTLGREDSSFAHLSNRYSNSNGTLLNLEHHKSQQNLNQSAAHHIYSATPASGHLIHGNMNAPMHHHHQSTLLLPPASQRVSSSSTSSTKLKNSSSGKRSSNLLNSISSQHSLTEYDSDPWCNAANANIITGNSALMNNNNNNNNIMHKEDNRQMSGDYKRALNETKIQNWKDNEVDIYVGQNHVVPGNRIRR